MGQPKHENEINQSELKASAGKKRWGQVTIGFDWSWKRSRKQQVCCDWLRDAPVFFFTNHSTRQQNANQTKQCCFEQETEIPLWGHVWFMWVNHYLNSVVGQDLNFQPSPWRDQRRRRKKTQLLENDFNYYFPIVLYKLMIWFIIKVLSLFRK